MDEWINKMWYTHTTNYYSILKRKKVLQYNQEEPWEHYVKWDKSVTKRQLLYVYIHTSTVCTTAAAAAESLQSCPTLCDPIDGSPPGSPVSGILQARTLEWVAISFSNAWKWKVKVKLLSRVRLAATPGTATYEAPLSMGFSRQEYWNGLPLPSPVCTTRVVKIIETESRMVLARAYGEGGVWSYGFDDIDLQFFKRKSCGDRW